MPDSSIPQSTTRARAPARPTRRRFLAAGVAGAVLLAIGGGVLWTRRAARAPSGALDADARAILRAIVPAMLAGALPGPPGERALAIDETVDGVDRAIAALPPPTRAELAQLFALLALAPGRRVFAGVPSEWPVASVDEVDAFLTNWRTSGWSLKRTAYDGLHALVIAAWYANPRSWPPVGYPGPPSLAT
jgi:hypothetical protein